MSLFGDSLEELQEQAEKRREEYEETLPKNSLGEPIYSVTTEPTVYEQYQQALAQRQQAERQAQAESENTYLNNLYKGAGSGFAGVGTGAARAGQLVLGTDGSILDSIEQGVDQNFGRSREWSWQDISNDFFGWLTDPSGATYAVGNQLGSMAAITVAGAALSAAIPETAVAGATAMLLRTGLTLGKVSKGAVGFKNATQAAKFLESDAGKLLVKDYIGHAVEAVSEGGSAGQEVMQRTGNRQDALKALTYDTIANIGILGASGALGDAVTAGMIANKGKGSLGRYVAGTAFNQLQDPTEEALQQTASEASQGQTAWSNLVQPWNWSQSAKDQFLETALVSPIISGGRTAAGKGINYVFGNKEDRDVQVPQQPTDQQVQQAQAQTQEQQAQQQAQEQAQAQQVARESDDVDYILNQMGADATNPIAAQNPEAQAYSGLYAPQTGGNGESAPAVDYVQQLASVDKQIQDYTTARDNLVASQGAPEQVGYLNNKIAELQGEREKIAPLARAQQASAPARTGSRLGQRVQAPQQISQPTTQQTTQHGQQVQANNTDYTRVVSGMTDNDLFDFARRMESLPSDHPARQAASYEMRKRGLSDYVDQYLNTQGKGNAVATVPNGTVARTANVTNTKPQQAEPKYAGSNRAYVANVNDGLATRNTDVTQRDANNVGGVQAEYPRQQIGGRQALGQREEKSAGTNVISNMVANARQRLAENATRIGQQEDDGIVRTTHGARFRDKGAADRAMGIEDAVVTDVPKEIGSVQKSTGQSGTKQIPGTSRVQLGEGTANKRREELTKQIKDTTDKIASDHYMDVATAKTADEAKQRLTARLNKALDSVKRSADEQGIDVSNEIAKARKDAEARIDAHAKQKEKDLNGLAVKKTRNALEDALKKLKDRTKPSDSKKTVSGRISKLKASVLKELEHVTDKSEHDKLADEIKQRFNKVVADIDKERKAYGEDKAKEDIDEALKNALGEPTKDDNDATISNKKKEFLTKAKEIIKQLRSDGFLDAVGAGRVSNYAYDAWDKAEADFEKKLNSLRSASKNAKTTYMDSEEFYRKYNVKAGNIVGTDGTPQMSVVTNSATRVVDPKTFGFQSDAGMMLINNRIAVLHMDKDDGALYDNKTPGFSTLLGQQLAMEIVKWKRSSRDKVYVDIPQYSTTLRNNVIFAINSTDHDTMVDYYRADDVRFIRSRFPRARFAFGLGTGSLVAINDNKPVALVKKLSTGYKDSAPKIDELVKDGYPDKIVLGRNAKDYRQGKNVSATEMLDEFGLANFYVDSSVSRNDVQKYINRAYDSLMDLSDLIGISPQALGLGGRLHLVVGEEQQSDGYTRPTASPSRDIKVALGNHELNNGGAMAHEWLHALDNYFGSQLGYHGENEYWFATKNESVTDAINAIKNGLTVVKVQDVRPEVIIAFAKLVKAIKGSKYRGRANKAYGASYYKDMAECAARAFESYLGNKLIERGERSNYLVPSPKNGVYLTDDEIKTFTKLFDEFFATFNEKEAFSPVTGRKITALYSATERQQVERAYGDIVKEVFDAFKGALITPTADGNVTAEFEDGTKYLVRIEDNIIVNESEKARAGKAHNLSGDANIMGKWDRAGAEGFDGVITISRNSERGTAFHEAFHAAMDMALAQKEKEALLKYYSKKAEEQGKDINEVMADAYRDWKLARQQHKGTIFGKLWQKVTDFCNKMASLFSATARANDVFQKIESNKVYNRGAKSESQGKQNQLQDKQSEEPVQEKGQASQSEKTKDPQVKLQDATDKTLGDTVELNATTYKKSKGYMRAILKEKFGRDDAFVDAIFASVDEILDRVDNIAKLNPDFRAWQEQWNKGVDLENGVNVSMDGKEVTIRIRGEAKELAPDKVDKDGNIVIGNFKFGHLPTRSSYKKNGEYELNIDLGTLCTKRESMDTLIAVLQQAVDGESLLANLGPTQFEALKSLLKSEGFMTACDICFVETKRTRALNDANKFAFEWKSTLLGAGIDDDVKLGERQSITEKQREVLRKMVGIVPQEKLDEFKEQVADIADKKERTAEYNKLVSAESDRLVAEAFELIPEDRKRVKVGKDGNPSKGADVDSGITIDKMQKIAKLLLEDDSLCGTFDPHMLLTTSGTDWLFRTYAHTNMANTIAGMFGSATAKPLEGFAVYDPLSWYLDFDSKKLNEGWLDHIYDIGGFRAQSFTDFNSTLFFDYVQLMADLQARDLPIHMYTKVPALATLFGLTGSKINMSLVAKVVSGVDPEHLGLRKATEAERAAAQDLKGQMVTAYVGYEENPTRKTFEEAVAHNDIIEYNGERFRAVNVNEDGYTYAWADESFPFDTAMDIRARKGYDKNVGVIAVALSQEHAKMLLADPNIDMVIPFHKSGMPQSVQRKTGLTAALDFTDFQTIHTARDVKDKNGNLVYEGARGENTNSKNEVTRAPGFDNIMREIAKDPKKRDNAPRLAAQEYLRLCQERRYIPIFESIAYDYTNEVFDENGKLVSANLEIDGKTYQVIYDSTRERYGILLEHWQTKKKGKAKGFDDHYTTVPILSKGMPKMVDGYYKLLENFRTVDADGKYAPQESVALTRDGKSTLPDDWEKKLRNSLYYRTEGDMSNGTRGTKDIRNMANLESKNQKGRKLVDLAKDILSRQRLDSDAREQLRKCLNNALGAQRVQCLAQEDFLNVLQKARAERVGEEKAKAEVEFFRRGDGIVYGFAHNGKIYLNENVFNANTPAHEFTHIWAKVVQKVNPELWDKAVRTLKNDAKEIWDTVENESSKNDNPYAYLNELSREDRDNAIASEVLARIVGGLNEEMVRNLTNPNFKLVKANGIAECLYRAFSKDGKTASKTFSVPERLVNFIRDIFKAVRSFLSGNNDDLTLEELVHMPLRTIYNEKEAKQFKKKLTEISKAPKSKKQLAMWSDPFDESTGTDNNTISNEDVRRMSGVELSAETVDGAIALPDDADAKFGLYINEGGKANSFVTKILNGVKKIETRFRSAANKIDKDIHVGDRIAIIAKTKNTPSGFTSIVGYATVAERIEYNTRKEFEADEERHLVDSDDEKYGWRDGGKVGYRFTNVKKLDNPINIPVGNHAMGHREIGRFTAPAREVDNVRKQYEGTDQWMKAPNGKATNLTEEQWLQVRTPAFKEWFGDWENGRSSSSVIVDENGEPAVMHHNTDANFTAFKKNKIGTGQGQAFLGVGFNFSRLGSSTYGNNEMECYLNLRKPMTDDKVTITRGMLRKIILELDRKSSERIEESWGSINDCISALMDYASGDMDIYAPLGMEYYGPSTDVMDAFAKLGFDGTVEHYSDGRIRNAVVFKPNQIKSATDNVGSFSSDTNDIRYSVKDSDEIPLRTYNAVLNEVKAAFPVGKFEKDNRGIVVTLPNGAKFLVNIKDRIILNARDQARADKAHGTSGGTAEGFWRRFTSQGVTRLLTIARDSDVGAAYHEALHAAIDLALTEKEKQTLYKYAEARATKENVDTEEVLAELYRNWVLARQQHRGTIFGKLLQKVKDLCTKVQALLGDVDAQAESIMQGIESGDVYRSGNKLTLGMKKKILAMVAYHGTPYNFDKFTLDHIGEGEGAQAHGWGLYFALQKKVSVGYAKKLSEKNAGFKLGDLNIKIRDDRYGFYVTINGKKYNDPTTENEAVGYIYENEGSLPEAIESLGETIERHQSYIEAVKASGELRDTGVVQRQLKRAIDARDMLKDWQAKYGDTATSTQKGYLYTVDIPEYDRMLDENKTYAEQPEAVRKALDKIFKDGELSPANIYKKTMGYDYQLEIFQGLGITEKRFDDLVNAISDYSGDSVTEHCYKLFKADLDRAAQKRIDDAERVSEEKVTEHYAGVVRSGFENDFKARTKLLANAVKSNNKKTGRGIYRTLASALGGKEEASRFLHENGIDGIKYHGGEDGPCAVVFNANAIKILDRFETVAETKYSVRERGQQQRTVSRQELQQAAEGIVPVKVEKDYRDNAYKMYNRKANIGFVHAPGSLNELNGIITMFIDNQKKLSQDGALEVELLAGAWDYQSDKKKAQAFSKADKDSQIKEGVAYFGRLYATDKAMAEAKFPEYFKAFESALARDKGLSEKLDTYLSAAEAFYRQTPEAKAKAGITELDDKPKSWKERVALGAKQFYADWFDDKDILRRVERKIETASGDLVNVDDSAYYQSRLANSAAASRIQMIINGAKGKFNKTAGKGTADRRAWFKALNEVYNGAWKNDVCYQDIVDMAITVGKDYLARGGFKDGMQALGSYLLANRYLEIWETKPDYKGSMSKATAEKVVANAPAEIKNAAQLYYMFDQNIVNVMHTFGMLNDKAYEGLNKYTRYCPLFRNFTDEAALDKFMGSLSNSNSYINLSNGIKALTAEGSDRTVLDDPTQSMARIAVSILGKVEKNKVAVKFVKLSDRSSVGQFVIPALDKNGEQLQTADPQFSRFTVWENGEKKAYITTKDIYDILQGSDVHASLWASLYDNLFTHKAATGLRKGATISPGFITRNFLKDTMSAIINSKYGFKPIIGSIQGMDKLLNDPEFRQRYTASGANMAGYFKQDQKGVEDMLTEMAGGKKWQQYSLLEKLKFLWEHYEYIGELVEQGTRAKEFELSLKAGNSLLQAAIDAKEVTLDFSRAGTRGRVANQNIPFFNAVLQGGDKMVRTCIEHPRKTATLCTSLALATICLWAINHGQPWYDELDDETKYSNWHFHVGNKHLVIPKPQEFGLLTCASMEAVLEQMSGKNPNAMKNWAKQFALQMTPSLFPALYKPILENWANYDYYFNSPVVSKKYDRLKPEAQINSNTSMVAVKAGKALGYSPIKIDHLIRGWFGGAGATVARIPNKLLEDGKQPAKYWNEMPYISEFIQNDFDHAKSINEWYDLKSELDKGHATYGVKGKPAAYMSGANKVSKQLSDIRKTVEAIKNSSTMSADVKRERIDKLNARAVKIAQLGLKNYQKYAK